MGENIHMLKIERNTDPEVSIRTGLNQIYTHTMSVCVCVCVNICIELLSMFV